MSKRLSIMGMLTVLLLAGCGDQSVGRGDAGGQAQQASATASGVENPWQKKLLALNEVDRKLALRRAVQDDGGDCRSIRTSAFQREYKGMAMWVAYCSNADWAIYVAPSGIIQARACKDAGQLGLPLCAPHPAEKPLQPLWSRESSPLPAPVNKID